MKIMFISNLNTTHDDWDIPVTFSNYSGIILVASDGTVGQFHAVPQHITIINAGTRVWSGSVWGI